jgi:hypothetical protein
MLLETLDFSQTLTSNPWLTLLSVIVAIVAVIVAIVFGIKSSRSRKPYFRKISATIVSDFTNKVQSIQMLFDGKPISDVTITRFLFWNAGRETIRKEDIAQSDPLRITVTDGKEILESKIVKENNDASMFKLSPIGRTALDLSFDFAERNQGAIIQVIHTGKTEKDIDLTGTVIGAGKPKLVRRPRFEEGTSPSQKNTWVMAIIALMFIGLGLVAGTYWIIFPTPTVQTSTGQVSPGSPLAGFLILATYVGMGSFFFYYAYFRQRLPPKLTEFWNLDA